MSTGRYGYVPRTESPYEVLGLTNPSSSVSYNDADVARAYRRASLQAHPDKPNGSKDKFERIQSSYYLIKTQRERDLFEKYGARMAPGPGHLLGNAVDKFLPLVLGLVGGLALAGAVVSEMSVNSVAMIGILTLGSGTTLSYKAPLGEVLTAGVGGMLIGSGIGGCMYGIIWSFSRIL